MEQPYVLATSLRCGKVVIECVLKKIVPFLKTHFRSYKEQVMKIIQGLQSCTRRLQVIITKGWKSLLTKLRLCVLTEKLLKTGLLLDLFQLYERLAHHWRSDHLPGSRRWKSSSTKWKDYWSLTTAAARLRSERWNIEVSRATKLHRKWLLKRRYRRARKLKAMEKKNNRTTQSRRGIKCGLQISLVRDAPWVDCVVHSAMRNYGGG